MQVVCFNASAREKKLENLCVEKNHIVRLCKCILFLPQMSILIIKISFKIEPNISRNFISINSAKTLISLLIWINKCLNELENLHILIPQVCVLFPSISQIFQRIQHRLN